MNEFDQLAAIKEFLTDVLSRYIPQTLFGILARSLGKSLDRDALQKYFDLVVSRAGETYEFLNTLFRGRETVLNQLHANVLRAKAGALANRTAIVHGAPGAGKSELMLQFMHQIVELHEEQIVAVRGSTSALRNAPLFVSQLLQSLPRTDRISNALTGLKRELHRMQSSSALGFSTTRRERRSPEPARSLDDHLLWLDGYITELPADIRERIFVYCVDEFQTLADPENSLCLPLHSAELGIRAVPVYFGLSDAPMVLAQASVSRVEDSNSIALGALDSESAFSLVRDFCDCMKIEYASNLDRDRIVRDVVARCDSWPHHLTAWMRTACETLPNCDYLITPEAHMEIDRRCDIHRKEYYAARLELLSIVVYGAV